MTDRRPEPTSEATPPPDPSPAAVPDEPGAAGVAPDLPSRPSMRAFFTLWTGQMLSLLGSHAVQFALVWWLTAETGSATVLATATMLGFLPAVVLGPVIGALVDRWNRKRIMLAADGLVGLASLVLAGLFAAGIAEPIHVMGLLFVRAIGGAFHQPAMAASTTLMVPEEHFTRIQGMNQSAHGLLLVVGAPIGAFLYAAMPMAGVVFVDVITAIVAIVPLLFIAVPEPTRSSEGTDDGRPTVWTDTLEGFRYLRARPGHLGIVGLVGAVNLLLAPSFSLMPLFALERLDAGATEVGWISSAFGVGMLVGGVLLGVWGGFSRRMVTALTGLIALGLSVFAIGVTPVGVVAWTLGAMFLVGAVVPLINGPIQAILQATVDPAMQGRVFTLLGSLSAATAPIGLAFAAPVAELVGLSAFYLAGGVVCVAMGALGFVIPMVLRVEDGAPVGEEAAPAASA